MFWSVVLLHDTGGRLNIDGLVQERCNSSASAMDFHLSCINPLIQWCDLTSIGIPMIKIRRSHDRFIWKDDLYIEMGPLSIINIGSSNKIQYPHEWMDQAWKCNSLTLKWKCRHFHQTLITGCTKSCQMTTSSADSDAKFHQKDNFFCFSLLTHLH